LKSEGTQEGFVDGCMSGDGLRELQAKEDSDLVRERMGRAKGNLEKKL